MGRLGVDLERARGGMQRARSRAGTPSHSQPPPCPPAQQLTKQCKFVGTEESSPGELRCEGCRGRLGGRGRGGGEQGQGQAQQCHHSLGERRYKLVMALEIQHFC